MQFDYSPKVKELRGRVDAFMQQHVFPNEQRFYDEVEENTRKGARWTPTKIVEELKPKARADGLWNLFLPASTHGAGLTNLEYAPLAELMGRVPWASEVFNCSAPDTGNMETIERYGNAEQKKQWLMPLLAGEIRSAFAMTEPAVASSDATNIQMSMRREGDRYVINGRKWWTSGAGDPRCKIYIVMGKTDPAAARHAQQSMILVPADTPGLKVVRPLNVFGYDDAPHGHMEVDLSTCACRFPASCSARDADSRSRRAGSDPAASITACGRSASPSAGWSLCASDSRVALRSAGRSRSRPSGRSASRRHAA
jgi:acyl-CoA dehydrogenase